MSGVIPVVIEGTAVITAVDRLIQDVAEHHVGVNVHSRQSDCYVTWNTLTHCYAITIVPLYTTNITHVSLCL